MIQSKVLCQVPLPYVTWSREMSHLSKKSISIFLHHCLTTSKCFILMQTPLQLDIRLQSYEEFDNAKNNIKQKEFEPCFANISRTTSPTSDSFLLIMSHIVRQLTKVSCPYAPATDRHAKKQNKTQRRARTKPTKIRDVISCLESV